MTERRFQDIWKEQCAAGRKVRTEHGVLSALDYLIGEKLLTYAEMAMSRAEFARDLPSFVAELRSIFEVEELRQYMEHLERMEAIEAEHVIEDDDDFLADSPEKTAERKDRIMLLKELLTSPTLGTG